MSFATRLRTAFFEFHRRHESLKRFVHEGMRYPLPPAGQRFMACVYFSLPVVGGWYTMQWAQGRASMHLGENGENLLRKKNDVTVEQSVPVINVGVPLAIASDAETDKRNQRKIRQFLRQKRKQMLQEEERKERDTER